jgi:hypothetical protein
VAEFTRAIARFDTLDFAPLFSIREGEATAAEMVLRTFDQILAQVHWFYLFEKLLELRGEGKTEPGACGVEAGFSRAFVASCDVPR